MSQSRPTSLGTRAVTWERNKLMATGSGDARSSPKKVRDSKNTKQHHLGGSGYLNPMMGHSLQMLHLAWCLAVSAAATRCRTGSHTMDWGSSRIQSRKSAASISGLLLACVDGRKHRGGGVGKGQEEKEGEKGKERQTSVQTRHYEIQNGSGAMRPLFTVCFCQCPARGHTSHLPPKARLRVHCRYSVQLLDDKKTKQNQHMENGEPNRYLCLNTPFCSMLEQICKSEPEGKHEVFINNISKEVREKPTRELLIPCFFLENLCLSVSRNHNKML